MFIFITRFDLVHYYAFVNERTKDLIYSTFMHKIFIDNYDSVIIAFLTNENCHCYTPTKIRYQILSL